MRNCALFLIAFGVIGIFAQGTGENDYGLMWMMLMCLGLAMMNLIKYLISIMRI